MTIVITEYRNAAALDANADRMDVEINHPEHGWIPYTIDASVTEPSVNHASLRSLIGSDYSAYVAPTQEELDAEAAAGVRAERDRRLVSEVDPVVSNPLRWADLSSQEQADVSAYRLALLDVPQQQGFPHTISWPTKPSCL
jgi:hypothetical protein